ncbi:MAG: UDP-3-O-(3-hydroxymyristoyl)glucosamine N-acyltransferase [Alphaproteobacteria bacterium]|nr:UDP-3-O-(3-hydroxymyristoyl)glucosamine N-acyltransferase [Alphaproteobacteria bacterium]
MPDNRFHKKALDSISLGEISDLVGCELSDAAAKDLKVSDVSPLDAAESGHVSFLDNLKYKSDFVNTRAAACFTTKSMAKHAPKTTICLITDSPYKSYALTAQQFYPENRSKKSSISDHAIIEHDVILGQGCVIEANVVIKSGAVLGQNCWIEAGTVIQENVQIGDNAHIGSNATISHSIIGDNVRIYTGARIGQDGFGFAIDPAGHVKIPQLGRVIIEDHVEIGANTTIDRGAGPDTIIGQGTWIDNLVQIGHNVRIGKGCVIVAQVGISGSTVLEDYVAFGGQAGIAGHLRVGKGAQVSAQAGVMNDIPAGEQYMGSPAFPRSQFLRQVATLNRLIQKKKSD